MNSLLTSARTSTDDGVNPIPAFEADGAVRPADLEPDLSPTAVGVGDHGRRDGDGRAVRPHAGTRSARRGCRAACPRPRITSSDPHDPAGGEGGGRPFEAQGRVGRGRASPGPGEKVTPADDAAATIRHALDEPGLDESPDLVGTHPGRHQSPRQRRQLAGRSNETPTLGAGRPLTSTTPLAWNVAIPHLRDCRGGVYDGAAAEVSGRGESAHESCRRGPSMRSAEADALLRRAGQLVPAASVGAAHRTPAQPTTRRSPPSRRRQPRRRPRRPPRRWGSARGARRRAR